MADVNIISLSPRLQKLLVLECERLGLSYTVTRTPEQSARLYISDSITPRLPDDKTIYIGVAKESALDNTFLLTDLRNKIIATLSHSEKKQSGTVRKQKRISLTLDPDSLTVSVRGGAPVRLSPTEYRLMHALNEKHGEILTYAEANALLSCEGSNKTNVYICLLRKKLEANGYKIIYSVRGKGFKIGKNDN